jgi:hypothetical protein
MKVIANNKLACRKPVSDLLKALLGEFGLVRYSIPSGYCLPQKFGNKIVSFSCHMAIKKTLISINVMFF